MMKFFCTLYNISESCDERGCELDEELEQLRMLAEKNNVKLDEEQLAELDYIQAYAETREALIDFGCDLHYADGAGCSFNEEEWAEMTDLREVDFDDDGYVQEDC
jgi:hypothetical protein